MSIPRSLAGVLAFILVLHASAQKPVKLELLSWTALELHEPSDMAVVPGSDAQRFYMVSDNGYVGELDVQGRLLRRSEEIAYDLEGIMVHGDELIVVDERARRILWLEPATFSVKRRLTVPYAGGRNKGYEAIAWNPVKQRFLLITERDPVTIFELDADMRHVNEHPFERGIRDISSATWHDGHLWLLSDMDMLVLKCDPQDYRVLERFHVPVINPEGFAFGRDGVLHVVSDDRERLYTFRMPR